MGSCGLDSIFSWPGRRCKIQGGRAAKSALLSHPAMRILAPVLGSLSGEGATGSGEPMDWPDSDLRTSVRSGWAFCSEWWTWVIAALQAGPQAVPALQRLRLSSAPGEQDGLGVAGGDPMSRPHGSSGAPGGDAAARRAARHLAGHDRPVVRYAGPSCVADMLGASRWLMAGWAGAGVQSRVVTGAVAATITSAAAEATPGQRRGSRQHARSAPAESTPGAPISTTTISGRAAAGDGARSGHPGVDSGHRGPATIYGTPAVSSMA